MIKRLRHFCYGDVRRIFASCVLAASAALTVTRFRPVLLRFFWAVADLFTGIRSYVLRLAGPLFHASEEPFSHTPSSVEALPEVSYSELLGFEPADLKARLAAFWAEFFDLYNFFTFLSEGIDLLLHWCLYLPLVVCLVICLFLLGQELLLTDKEKPIGHESKPYRAFLGFVAAVLLPCYRLLRTFCEWWKTHRGALGVLIAVWLLNFNVLSIALSLLGFYFYFVATFDLAAFGVYLLKLFLDLLTVLHQTPFLVLLAAFVLGWIAWAVAKGFDELEHMEAKNCGVIKSLQLCSVTIGPPGWGKTQFITDASLSSVNIDKQDALDILMERELLFPAFSWCSYRDDLLMRMVTGEIFVPVAVDYHVAAMKEQYDSEQVEPYGYRTDVYSMEKNVGNRVVNLWDTLCEYGRAYVIYLQDNPSLANYPIRFDGCFDDSLYFPFWKGGFFRTSARELESRSRYSHILDQDILRLGKHVKPNNPLCGTFGYGIYTNTEWGKCRGNQVTNADLDIKDELANAKNDLYAYSLKMCRHNGCTVAGRVFFRFFGDEQRPQSLAQDQRDLCSVITIVDRSETRLALPGGAVLDWIHEHVYRPVEDFCKAYANKRGDTILTVQLLKNAAGAFLQGYQFVYNLFGYRVLTLKVEDGTAYGDGGTGDGSYKLHEYYLMNKKIFSERYLTDCYTAFFEKAQLDAGLGLDDVPTYRSKKMSPEEMELQHDYFLMKMMRIMSGEEEAAPPSSSGKAKKSKAAYEPWSDGFSFQKV